MGKFENDLLIFNEMMHGFEKADIMNEIKTRRIVPIIRNGKLAYLQVNINENFYDLKHRILNDLSINYTIYGIYDVYNVHFFNTPYSAFESLRPITLEDAKKYRLSEGLSSNYDISKYKSVDDEVYHYLNNNGFKACTIKNYPRLYQIMNVIEDKIDLAFIIKYLCQYIKIDYDYCDKFEYRVVHNDELMNGFETSKEKLLSEEERIQLLNELFNCFDICDCKKINYIKDREVVLKLAKRNTDIINSNGFKSLMSNIIPNIKNKLKVRNNMCAANKN